MSVVFNLNCFILPFYCIFYCVHLHIYISLSYNFPFIMSVPHAHNCSVLVTDIPIQATLEQVQLHLSRAGTIASISNMYRTGGGTGMSLYCHYRFPQNAAHAITHLSGQSFLNGFPRIVQAFPQPPPPGTVPIPMASLLPTSADALHTSTPLPVLHPHHPSHCSNLAHPNCPQFPMSPIPHRHPL